MQDVGRYLRLQSAIRAAIDAVPDGQAVVAGQSMTVAYRRFREQASHVIPPEAHAEFDAMFPNDVGFERANPPDRLLDAAGQFMAARLLLSTLAGWLDGYVTEARMAAEAQAYADARVREERGVGYKAQP